MFKRFMHAITSEVASYRIWVFFFILVVAMELHPATILIYGYFMSRRAYDWGRSVEKQEAINLYKPALEEAQEQLGENAKVMREANREISLLKEKLGEYENIS